MLTSCRFDREQKSLSVDLEAFPGHENETHIVSPWPPSAVLVNGAQLGQGWGWQQDGNLFRAHIGFCHGSTRDSVQVQY
jgi:hypothetical protein